MKTPHLLTLSKILKPARVGMTLVEIMIVLTIIGSIMAFAAYSLLGTSKGAQIVEAEAEVNRIKGMIELYYLTYRELPDSLDDLTVDNGRGNIADVVPDDPWGNPYEYSTGNDGTFEIFSVGPNGSSHDDDDIYPEGAER